MTCGNLPECKRDNSYRVAKVGGIYTLQINESTVQALTNQRQHLILEWSLVSARPTARCIKMRFTGTLSTSEHLLYWQRHKPAPLEIASISITRQSLPRS
jgi:hypothetical protein